MCDLWALFYQLLPNSSLIDVFFDALGYRINRLQWACREGTMVIFIQTGCETRHVVWKAWQEWTCCPESWFGSSCWIRKGATRERGNDCLVWRIESKGMESVVPSPRFHTQENESHPIPFIRGKQTWFTYSIPSLICIIKKLVWIW